MAEGGYLQEVRQEAGVVRRGRQRLLGAVAAVLDPPGHEVGIRLEEERRGGEERSHTRAHRGGSTTVQTTADFFGTEDGPYRRAPGATQGRVASHNILKSIPVSSISGLATTGSDLWTGSVSGP